MLGYCNIYRYTSYICLLYNSYIFVLTPHVGTHLLIHNLQVTYDAIWGSAKYTDAEVIIIIWSNVDILKFIDKKLQVTYDIIRGIVTYTDTKIVHDI